MRTINSFRSIPKLINLAAWPTIKVMATCEYSSYMLESHADRVNSENPANVQCARLGNGQKEVKVHLKSLNVRNGSFRTESQLLLARAGMV